MAHATPDPHRPTAIPAELARSSDPACRVTGLAQLTMRRPDLDRARRFLTDFGLHIVDAGADRIDLCGDGPDPVIYTAVAGPAGFVGLTFTVDDAGLSALAAREGVPIEPHDAPGGGRRVRLVDPNGWQIDVVAGQTPRAEPSNPAEPSSPASHAERTARGAPEDGRRVDAPVRMAVAAPAIRHLGHVAVEVVDFTATVRWYIDRFGLIASDVQLLDDGAPALVFLRCDRGPAPTDHHTLVVSRSYQQSFNHAAFEVDDYDAVAMGQRVLDEAGWRHAWGIGRHLMGSQIFDYWRDPWGALHEHYADGDHFGEARPTGTGTFSRRSQSQWGPLMPRSFLDTPTTPRRLWALVRNLWRSPELTLARLLSMWRAMR